MTANVQEHPSETLVDLSLEIISEAYNDLANLARFKRKFRQQGYVHLPKLLDRASFEHLAAEMSSIEKSGRDRSFVMPGYETPRVLRTVGGQAILRRSPSVAALYFHRDLIDVIENVSGARVFPCQHTEEFMVANFLTSAGSTHGWHLDDPPLALVVFFEAPETDNQGGQVEYIPGWHEFCLARSASPTQQVDSTVDKARSMGLIQSASHKPGDAYLLRADRSLHRVTPITAAGCRRVVLNMAYQLVRNQDYGDTATLLYGVSPN